MRIWLLCFAVSVSACGGIIDNGDGGTTGVDSGTQKDAPTGVDVKPPPPPPPPNCSQIQTETAIGSDGSCTSSASWSCGDTKYSVQCSCPSTQCSCSQESNGMGSGTIIKEPTFCPKCDGAQMPKICGFPTN